MGLGKFFKSLFSKVIKVFRAFLDEALPLATQYVMGELKDIALVAVQEMTVSNLSNDDKRKEAFKRIKDYAVKNSIQGAKDSIINTLIELALLKYKSEFDK